MNVRAILRGGEQSPARYGTDTHADSGFTTHNFQFPRGDAAQTIIDIGAIFMGFLLATVAGLAIAASVFVLLMV